jgi:excinuclease ABC subunit A
MPYCHGDRLKPTSLLLRWAASTSVIYTDERTRELDFINGFSSRAEHMIADGILKEIRERLGFLQNVGLDYLTLRATRHAVRAKASASASLHNRFALTGLYVLDEPASVCTRGTTQSSSLRSACATWQYAHRGGARRRDHA